MLLLLLWTFFSLSDDLPRLYVTDSPWSEEFSERTSHAPFQKLSPQPLQITSPYFENLFLGSTGVQSRSQGSPATSIRGSSQAARVLFLLDNLPLNFLDGFGGSSQFIPNEILQQINIFEGPTSALYGASAMGGSIHFVPKKRQTPLLRLGLSDTDNSAVDGESLSIANGALILPLLSTDSDTLQLSAFAEKDRGDFPYKEESGAKGQRQNNQQQLTRFTLLGRHTRDHFKISHLLLYSDLQKTSAGSLFSPLVTKQKTKAFLAGATAEVKTTADTLWVSRVSYAALHSDFLDNASSVSNSDKIWVSQTFSWEFAPGFLSQTLFDLNHNFYTASFVQNQKFERSEPELAQSFILPLTKNIFVEPSVRHLFRYDETLFQLNIPIVFDSSRLWLMYSEGFRPPSLTDLYAQTSYFIGNTQLRPEKSQQYEFGHSWQHHGVTLSNSVFLLKYEDLLQSSVLPTSEFTKVNIGQAETYGINGKLEIHQPRWQAQLSHTYMIARETPSNERLRFSPEHQTFASVSYLLTAQQTLTLQQSVWSPIVDLDFINNQNVRLTDWSSTDVLWMHRWRNERSIQIGVYNLWNQRRELTYGYPEPQRRVALAFETTF